MSCSHGPWACLSAALVLFVSPAASAQEPGALAGAVSSQPQQIGVAAGSPKEAAAQTSRLTLPAIHSTLAAGDWQGARRSLHHLALLISQSYGLRGLEAMQEEILATTKTPGLMAMTLLLFDVYQEALGSRQYLVSTASRGMAFACLERLESAPGVPAALVADVYTLLGCRLQAAGAVSVSRDSFQRAVKLDPQLGPAWLGLGVYLENLGHDDEAVEVFGRLPAVQPYHGEASLRRALALERLGRDRLARRALEELVDPEAPSQPEPWVQSVAFQELAMLLLREQGPVAAREVLRLGVQRLPHERRLYLLLAFVHNTLGRRGDAAAVLAGMEEDATPETDSDAEPDARSSPRHRLAGWRVEVPAGLESRLRRQAETALATGRLTP